MPEEAELRQQLRRLDGRGYKAYKDLRGRHELGELVLWIDHVQGDPFAAPSRVRLRLPRAVAGPPPELDPNRVRRIALEDFLARQVEAAIRRRPSSGARQGGRRGAAPGRAGPGRAGSGKSGLIQIDAGRQTVLERTAVRVTDDFVEARLEVGLPAAGRRVLGREAEALLLDDLPEVADQALRYASLPAAELADFVADAENHAALCAQLPARSLVAFIADGSVLPRASGASDRPLESGAVPLHAPASLRVTLDVPNPVKESGGKETRQVSGLGIPRGVTLIVGGGYHGKSTLLHAIERGMHPHVPGDGRERVASLAEAVKIRAEDGRSVVACDIHAFIADLPHGRDTRRFDSQDASGSTSQAAGIVEAIEAGATCLLLDEDTSATNFMVRDARMQALVHRDHEPITPFVDRVRELYDELGVSTVLVMGGCGDYFDVADTVIEMREYVPHDVTDRARQIASENPGSRQSEIRGPLEAVGGRIPDPASIDPARGRRDVKIDTRGTDELGFGESRIDLRSVEQLLEASQTRAIGHALVVARERFMGRDVPVARLLDQIDALLDEQGIDALDLRGANLARPRRFEIAAALNRLRGLRILS